MSKLVEVARRYSGKECWSNSAAIRDLCDAIVADADDAKPNDMGRGDIPPSPESISLAASASKSMRQWQSENAPADADEAAKPKQPMQQTLAECRKLAETWRKNPYVPRRGHEVDADFRLIVRVLLADLEAAQAPAATVGPHVVTSPELLSPVHPDEPGDERFEGPTPLPNPCNICWGPAIYHDWRYLCRKCGHPMLNMVPVEEWNRRNPLAAKPIPHPCQVPPPLVVDEHVIGTSPSGPQAALDNCDI